MPRPTEDEFDFSGLLDVPAYNMLDEGESGLYTSRPGKLSGEDRLRLRRRTLYYEKRAQEYEENERT